MRLTSWLALLNVRSNRPRRQMRRSSPAVAAIVESLESRKLLSAAAIAAVPSVSQQSNTQSQSNQNHSNGQNNANSQSNNSGSNCNGNSNGSNNSATTSNSNSNSSSSPTISNIATSLVYTEGAPPEILSGRATISDSNNAFASSTLTVDITNGLPGDQLGILNGNGVGLGPKGAVMFAASQSATPEQVATATGGAGNSAMVVTFNSNATQASVQAVLDQFVYGNGTSTFQTPDRSISFKFTDGKGATSSVVSESVHVNPAPVVSNVNPGNPIVYTEGAPPIPVAPQGRISDAPNAYNGSTLSVQIQNGQPGDQVGVAPGNGVGVGPNGAVLYSPSAGVTPVVIGTMKGGSGGAPLVVTFNSNATNAGVQAVLNQVVYGNGTSTFQTPDRQVGIVFTDGNHVASVPTGVLIHVNPAPVIGNTGTSPVNYAVNANPVVLAPQATIADAPNAYANSKLTVQLSGGTSSDQLAVLANRSLSVGANDSLVYNGTIIGTYSGGSGSQPLVVQFNASATQASVQSVIDSITFACQSTSSNPALSNRLATFTWIDGNGVPSAHVGVGIHVTKSN